MKQIDIISEILMEIQKFSKDREYQNSETKHYIPGMIPTGAGGGYLISKAASKKISMLTKSIINSKPEFTSRYSRKDTEKFVTYSLGTAIFEADKYGKNDIESIFELFKIKIEQISAKYIESDFIFGCKFFEIEDLDCFEVGEVKFCRPKKWITNCIDSEKTNSTLKQKMISVEAKLQIGDDNFESIEFDNLDSLLKNSWLCTVKINGLGNEFSIKNALLAANLSFTGLSLMWGVPSKILKGLYTTYDTNLYSREYFITTENSKEILGGKSLSQYPRGETIEIKDFYDDLEKFKFLVKVTEEVVSLVIAPFKKHKNLKMVECFTHSLTWFREGCRETNDMIAIVKFCASMDTLAQGKKSKGIIELLNNRLGADKNNPIKIGDEELSAVVKRIYDQGRSRLIHGTPEKMLVDWSLDRELAEVLARNALIYSMLWYYENDTDDPQKLRNAKNKRTAHQAASSN